MQKRSLLLFIILIFVVPPILMALIFNAPPMFTEPYYYIPWHILLEPPEFCAVEFEDLLLPTAPEKMHLLAKNAIDDWKSKLIQHTEYEQGWDFKFRTVSEEAYKNGFLDECSVTISFQRHPIILEEAFYEGYAYSIFGISDITIFYLSEKYDIEEMTTILNDDEFQEQNLSKLYDNQISSNLENALRHEIGHSLGLDHPLMESPYELNENKVLISNSIMITPEIYPDLPNNLLYEITDYDIKSVVNLYGERGIDEYEFGVLLSFVFIGVIIWILVMVVFVIYLIRKKLGKNESNNYISINSEDSFRIPSETVSKTPLQLGNFTEHPKSKKYFNYRPTKKPVNINWQTAFMFIGPLGLWAAYRIEKLRKFLLIFVLGFGVGGTLLEIIIFPDEFFTDNYAVPQWFTLAISVSALALSIMLIRDWSREWNSKCMNSSE